MNRVSSLCHHWREMGHEITVLTAYPNYPTGVVPPQYHWKLRVAEELDDGTQVRRYWHLAAPTEGVVKRTLSHLSFAGAAFVGGLRDLRRCDVLVVSSPPVLQLMSAMYLGWVLDKPWIYDMRDPTLQAAAHLRVVSEGFLYRRMRAMEKAFYRRCAAVVVVAQSFRDLVMADGADPDKTVFIPNGADLAWVDSIPVDPQATRQQLGLDDKFTVAYIGTHGIMQGAEFIAQAAKLLDGQDDIQFLFVGGGCNKERIKQWAEAEELDNVHFMDIQPRERVIQMYSAVDLPVVSMEPHEFLGKFLPSKMFEIMAARQPMLAAVHGEARQLLKQSGAAILCEPGNPESIAQGILAAQKEHDQLAQLGLRGRQFVEENYDRATLAKQYEQLLTDVVSRTG